MSTFSTLRAILAADLEPLGVPIYPSWPTELAVPCAFLLPPLAGSEYVAAGPTFGSYTLSVDLMILVAHAPAEDGLAALETLIQTALINTMDWVLRGVESPAPVTVTEGGAEYLGTVIHLSKSTALN